MLVTMTECIKNLHLIFNEDEDNNKFIQNGVRPISRKRCQQICNLKAATIPLVGKGCQRVLRILLSCAMLLAGFPTSISASNTGECPTEQYIQLMGRAVVKCHGLEDFPFIYWYDSTDEDAIAFIQKVHGEVAGQGYTTGEFDIDNEGSLVINNVKIRDEKTFRVRVLDSALLGSSYDITLIVYVEPAEPLPVIPECSGQPTCILKGDSVRGISCIHGGSRPAMELSWFLRVGRQDRLLNATINQTVSADSLTFTTSAQLALEKILIDTNMNHLLVLVCKSSQPIPSMKGSERIILLDLSVDVPFTNEEYLDPVYAIERQEDFMMRCQFKIDTGNNVVLWMYKPLNSEKFEYIVYSAYGGVTSIPEGNARFNLTNNGALVIKQIDVQDEGYYACLSSSEITTVSFVHNIAVIVLPTPPRIVVQGCEPFHPCHLSAQEAETITCAVNGVRPQLDLSIVTYSMNVAVTETAINSHKEDGLFYTTIEGRVDVSKITCKENVTVICQARGPAAYGFMSDAYVTVPVDGDDCAGPSTDMEIPDDGGSGNDGLGLVTMLTMLTMALLILVLTISVIIMGRRMYRRHLERSSRHGCNNGPL